MAYIDELLNELERQKVDVSSLRDYAAQGDYRSLYGALNGATTPLGGRVSITPEGEKYFDLMINQQAAEEARAYDKEMSETDLIRGYKQLEQLGLNPSLITDIGGSAYHGGNVVAQDSNVNVAAQKYAQQQQMARQMIGLVTALAGAGIHGAAYSAARTAAANIAGDTARTVQNMRNMGRAATHYAYQKDSNGNVTGYTKFTSDYVPYSW